MKMMSVHSVLLGVLGIHGAPKKLYHGDDRAKRLSPSWNRALPLSFASFFMVDPWRRESRGGSPPRSGSREEEGISCRRSWPLGHLCATPGGENLRAVALLRRLTSQRPV